MILSQRWDLSVPSLPAAVKIFCQRCNFLHFHSFVYVFITKTVEIWWNLGCKIFGLKIWRCKLCDNSHVCTSIKSFLSVFYASYTSLYHLLQLVPKSQTFSLGSLVTQPEHHCCRFLALCVKFSDMKISSAMPKKKENKGTLWVPSANVDVPSPYLSFHGSLCQIFYFSVNVVFQGHKRK